MSFLFKDPSAAFDAATKQLRDRFAFPLPVQALMNRLAANVLTDVPWHPYQPNFATEKKTIGWVKHESDIAVMKPVSASCSKDQIDETNIIEKLVTDIGHGTVNYR